MTASQRDSALHRGADPVALTLHLLAAVVMRPDMTEPWRAALDAARDGAAPCTWGRVEDAVYDLAPDDDTAGRVLDALEARHAVEWHGMSLEVWVNQVATPMMFVALVNRTHHKRMEVIA